MDSATFLTRGVTIEKWEGNPNADSTDPSKHKDIYAKAQKIILEDQTVLIPLYYEPTVALVQPRVHGLVVNPIGYLYLAGVSVDR